MDGAFSVIVDGVQRNLHVSRWLNMERMDLNVGPLSIDVVEPLKVLRVKVAENEHGISADLTFTGRTAAIKEPQFTRRIGPRAFMQYTRLTQNGNWEGWIEVKGKRVEVTKDQYLGTRDRSWGVRPVGSNDPQPHAPAVPIQYYWLWAPLNFDDRITLYHTNEDSEGEPWNEAGVMCLTEGSEPEHIKNARSEVKIKSGSRHVESFAIFFDHKSGGQTTIKVTPRFNFSMTGIGYGNTTFGHGVNKGDLAIGYDEHVLAEVTSCAPPHLHIQAFAEAEMTLPNGEKRMGVGILEQLIIGPHKPLGFKEILDMAP
jgi:hypothetical protein